MEYIPYTYLIGWPNLNKWYYGVEYGTARKTANPSNLWTTYFTSSEIVSFYRNRFGEPDIIQVRKIFNWGLPQQRMAMAIKWEKSVLTRIGITNPKWLNGRIGGDITPQTNKKIAQTRYGVDNVFQAEEIKNKIRQSNLSRYGVEYPQQSITIRETTKYNNLQKYGVENTLQLQVVKDKIKQTNMKRYGVASASQCDSVKKKIGQTNLERYGVTNPGACPAIMRKVLSTRRNISNRHAIKLLRQYVKAFDGITLGSGWYQCSDEKLLTRLSDVQKTYGIYTYEQLAHIQQTKGKKYTSSIKKLQERPLVKQILKYKQKYGKKIAIGRGWDRKNDIFLTRTLEVLMQSYGSV